MHEDFFSPEELALDEELEDTELDSPEEESEDEVVLPKIPEEEEDL